MLAELGPQRGLDHTARQLREQPARAGDLLRRQALQRVLQRVRRQQRRKPIQGSPTSTLIKRSARRVTHIRLEFLLGHEAPSRPERAASVTRPHTEHRTDPAPQTRGGHDRAAARRQRARRELRRQLYDRADRRPRLADPHATRARDRRVGRVVQPRPPARGARRPAARRVRSTSISLAQPRARRLRRLSPMDNQEPNQPGLRQTHPGSDRDRDADLLNAGFSTLRITDHRLKHQATQEAKRLHEILRRANASADPDRARPSRTR